jgi:glucose-6-phosphate 1-dehydrogenase
MATSPVFRSFGSCNIEISNPCCLVIFGGHGDLSKRKLMPALYQLHRHRLLPNHFFILATDIVDSDTEAFRELMASAVKANPGGPFDEDSWNSFAPLLHYLSFDYGERAAYAAILKKALPPLEREYATEGNRVYYLAVPPALFEPVIRGIESADLSDLLPNGYPHIVIEKPFGRDLSSAQELNKTLTDCFDERQIFRIDHYIAKEAVQNMLIFRFGNSIFEPLWNRAYIDHVQITVSETLGVEHRAAYYEGVWGVLRDMFQSHILQLVSLIAMEPPVRFEADDVTAEKIKVFRSIRRLAPEDAADTIVLGQYGSGRIEGRDLPAYREEPGIPHTSNTPSYAALKLFIDNWRWDGVPFYLRSGKRLSNRKTEISIHFKEVPHLMFSRLMDEPIGPNVLVFRVQPQEGINLAFHTKKPGSRVCLNPESVTMDFTYDKEVFLDAYEWVLLDCMSGDRMLFPTQEGVEETWSLLTPFLQYLEATVKAEDVPIYEAGTAGPEESDRFMERDHRAWRLL